MLTVPTSMMIKRDHFRQDDQDILTNGALNFIEKLHQQFNDRRMSLLQERHHKQERFEKGERPDFLEETKHIRTAEWQIAPLPNDLRNRRVEITGPVHRKMMIHALNSGATGYMADFEDATSPTWENMLDGQRNLRAAIRRQIDFVSEQGKNYSLNEETAVLMVRPRGWHLDEKHITIDAEYVSASLLDFGLYVYHNAKELINQGTGPYFYLPKIENHLEARLWDDVFTFAEKELNIQKGMIKATVLIETITAAFEMDEILYELREHSAGLNCGRWDYIFSYIKKCHAHPDFFLPNRSQVTMNVPFMNAYCSLAVKTCHKRHAPAMGGMAAQIPIKNDEAKNEEAFMKVYEDKKREVQAGFDGTWVAHPGMVSFVKDIFDREMPESNQIARTFDYDDSSQEELLASPTGTITKEGIETNIRVGIQYIAAWLSGHGAVPINHLMEDAATAEISRMQLWQWIHGPNVKTDDGDVVTETLIRQIFTDVTSDLQTSMDPSVYQNGNFQRAGELFMKLVTDEKFTAFLTLPAYDQLINEGEM